MGKQRTPLFINGFIQNPVNIVPGDGTDKKVLLSTTGYAEGLIVKSMNIATTEVTNAMRLFLFLNTSADGLSGTDYPLGVVLVPLEAGTKSDGTVVSVKGLDETKIRGLQKDIQGNYILKLKGGYSLKGSVSTALGSGKAMSILTEADIITADA